MLGELITVTSADGLELDGIIFRSGSSRTTILHVHGSFGNFYHGRLLKTMAKVYPAAGLNLLSVNMASHDGVAEGHWHNGEFSYVGGSVAEFSRCRADLAGAISFAKQFSDRIVLQGHSLGCDRVLSFLIDESESYELVLLAPCDSYRLQKHWIAPESIQDQITRLKSAATAETQFDWLPPEEYGVRETPDWTYRLPVTRRAFLSIAEGAPYKLINLEIPSGFSLTQKALVCIGGNDALQVWPHELMFDYFQQRCGHVKKVFISSADHMFAGFEQDVADSVSSWIASTSGM